MWGLYGKGTGKRQKTIRMNRNEIFESTILALPEE
jgi:hypothetical protein